MPILIILVWLMLRMRCPSGTAKPELKLTLTVHAHRVYFLPIHKYGML